MEKAYFTDMDSTIICSGVQDQSNDLICVAVKNGAQASFMRKNSLEEFKEITRRIFTVPITTRCEASYKNIFLKELFEFALVDNGAILLKGNTQEKDLQWLEESFQITEPWRDNFNQVRLIIESYGYKEKWGSDFVLDYTHNNISNDEKERLKAELMKFDGLLVNVGNSSCIVTFKCLSKGETVKRFSKKYNYMPYISSGDNDEDQSMFTETQISVGKKNATYNLDTKNKLEFCDFVIHTLYELIK